MTKNKSVAVPRAEARFFQARLALLICAAVFMLSSSSITSPASAGDPPMDPPSHHTGDAGPQHPEHGSMGNVGAKLANPVSDMWSIQFNVQGPTFSDGDLSSGDPEVGGNVVFQPVMPIPIYGSGKDIWRLIVRPVLPIVFSQSVPECATPGCDKFDTKRGLGDWNWELFLTAPSSFTKLPESLILGVGTTLVFPTPRRTLSATSSGPWDRLLSSAGRPRTTLRRWSRLMTFTSGIAAIGKI
jgi:hypothetical protein